MTRSEKRVLIIDDEKRMADSLRDLLRVSGYGAESAYGGNEGLELLQKETYDVVVTDLRMPHTDGVDVMSFITNRCPRTLIVVITGHATTESAIEAVHYHVFDYLRKPFDFNLFKMAIEKAFQRIETDQLREDTMAMISHDIKIPLTSIIGFTAMLYDRDSEKFHPKAPDYVQTIQANGQKMLALIDNYLATCRIESGTLRPMPQTVKIERLLGDAVEMATSAALRTDQALELEVGDGLAEAYLDSGVVDRAISNLIQNAIKYGDAGAPIKITAQFLAAPDSELKRPTIAISVLNRCNGPMPVDFDEIFKRYERAGIRPGVEGAGLGLYVVEAVAKAHGGIARAAMFGEDSVQFTILLPLRTAGTTAAGRDA